MRYDGSVDDCPVDICELFSDLFESVYHASGPSDVCGFSGIWLRMSDLEAAISGLDANKRPGNESVPPIFIKLSPKKKCISQLYIKKNAEMVSNTNWYRKKFDVTF
jgi:hypothetical protein